MTAVKMHQNLYRPTRTNAISKSQQTPLLWKGLGTPVRDLTPNNSRPKYGAVAVGSPLSRIECGRVTGA